MKETRNERGHPLPPGRSFVSDWDTSVHRLAVVRMDRWITCQFLTLALLLVACFAFHLISFLDVADRFDAADKEEDFDAAMDKVKNE